MSADVLGLMADAVICTDEVGRILLFNRAAERSFGYSAAEVLGEHVEMLLPERHRAQHAEQVRSFASGDGAADRLMGHRREVWGRRKNGEEFPAEASVTRHYVEGRTVLTAVHRQIAERKELEEQRETIARELDHRIRNVLSVVSSLVSMSARSASGVDDFKHSLQERLVALARTQTFLRRSQGSGIDLGDVLQAELAHYRSSDGENLVITGEPVTLASTAVQSLALVIHELATNSAKYGAFSAPGGRVAVTIRRTCDEDGNHLTLEWRETGGPPVQAPSRHGFGTTLIEQVVQRVFRAEVRFDYRAEGLLCRMKLPHSVLKKGAGHAGDLGG